MGQYWQTICRYRCRSFCDINYGVKLFVAGYVQVQVQVRVQHLWFLVQETCMNLHQKSGFFLPLSGSGTCIIGIPDSWACLSVCACRSPTAGITVVFQNSTKNEYWRWRVKKCKYRRYFLSPMRVAMPHKMRKARHDIWIYDIRHTSHTIDRQLTLL